MALLERTSAGLPWWCCVSSSGNNEPCLDRVPITGSSSEAATMADGAVSLGSPGLVNDLELGERSKVLL